MISEASLLWHGPAWVAGQSMPGSSTGISLPGITPDQDLVALFKASQMPANALPSAVLVNLGTIADQVEHALFWSWLQRCLDSLPSEVPVILLSDQTSRPPDITRPTAFVDRRIRDQDLFNLVCDCQRALIRSEEARIRRISFGRIPGYGSPPHYRGTSGLLIIGMGGRFLQLQQAGEQERRVTVVGAFDQYMGEHFLTQRAFDAVILDTSYQDCLENLHQLRLDARFAALPVLAITDQEHDVSLLFQAGASDVILAPIQDDILKIRLSTAIRSGKRRRLADKMLAESHRWLTEQLKTGGVPQEIYERYLDDAGMALARRGLEIWELKLLPENTGTTNLLPSPNPDLFGTLLSVADATSREEDLVCFVQNVGPVAVLKSERGKERLQTRINAILGHTNL